MNEEKTYKLSENGTKDNRHEKIQQNAENLNSLLFPALQFKQSIEYAKIGDVHQTLRKK